jgi:hypothetical protein
MLKSSESTTRIKLGVGLVVLESEAGGMACRFVFFLTRPPRLPLRAVSRRTYTNWCTHYIFYIFLISKSADAERLLLNGWWLPLASRRACLIEGGVLKNSLSSTHGGLVTFVCFWPLADQFLVMALHF